MQFGFRINSADFSSEKCEIDQTSRADNVGDCANVVPNTVHQDKSL